MYDNAVDFLLLQKNEKTIALKKTVFLGRYVTGVYAHKTNHSVP
jgi:hypothetical protein